MKNVPIPQKLFETLNHPEGLAWLETLPDLVAKFSQKWSITMGEPFAAEASCSWVAPCIRSDGTQAVFKLGWPHMEAEDEITALQFWDGDPTVYLLEAERTDNAMLLERCQPGTVLRTLPEVSQDEILAKLMKRLWRRPAESFSFRPLSEMITFYIEETRATSDVWPDPAIAEAGIHAYQSLLASTTDHVLLATDLHAGNVLRAQREPWLVIDPKPFVGDPAYDATQHLLNCWGRLRADPLGTINRFASLLEIDPTRVKLWLFARLATLEWGDPNETLAFARQLAP